MHLHSDALVGRRHAEMPDLEGMMATKREEAAEILNKIPKTPVGIRSDKQPELFLQWTGYKHEDMLQSWRENMNGPTLLTACGGFASKFAGLIGIAGIKSYFELQKSLTEAGKSHAWVPASSGAKPQVGDILRHTVYHVDVAAGWDGPKLVRVAAGQSSHPRPTKNVENEFDALKWVTGAGPYNSANLQGWLDLDKYFGGSAAPSPVPTRTVTPPGWLFGWWRVDWRGDEYRYFFYREGTVEWTEHLQQPTSRPPLHTDGTGTFVFDPLGKIIIQWDSGSVETFSAAGSTRAMRGTWTGRDGSQAQLTASKLDSSFVA
jgi:hypothetical protein